MCRHGGCSIHIDLQHAANSSSGPSPSFQYPHLKIKNTLPCKLGFLTVQGPQQDDNLSIAPEIETSALLDCMTFSSEGMHHHIPLENLTPCTSQFFYMINQ